MTARSGILAGGNWIVDKLKFIDTWPQQDALANILSESVGNGGSPFNLLMNLARLGAPFSLAGIGLIGKDADGEWISEQCAASRINTEQLKIHLTAPTSYTDVMSVQSSGRRTFFHQRGANAFLGDEHFDFGSTKAKIFHLGYLLLLDRMDEPDPEFGVVAARTLQRARQAGCQTSIDVVSEDSRRFAKIVLPVLPFVDFCFLNEFELERTTGIATRQGQDIDLSALKTAAKIIIKAGVQKWVVVHFQEGACALGRDGKFHIRTSLNIPLSKIVSTVGAGDAFAAGVLYAFHEGATIVTALRYGTCAAAACLCGAGASDGLGQLEKCLALEDAFGIRAGPGEAV
ncbi:MAG TPA: carbohydrate kinase family protein [Verrucomicrobiae bacterium]|jgi:sugar/nucleoside kinase (ribokinase family)|nr:carbohydrate kinase family protein [Verrucomicrobiae bacterium]